jgi:hypothetical protein
VDCRSLAYELKPENWADMMIWDRFPARLQERLSGPVWDEGLREKFVSLSEFLMAPSPRATCELATIYVKFLVPTKKERNVYAVVWIKNSQKWMVGLALPSTDPIDGLLPQPKTYTYEGLTHCFYLEPSTPLPSSLESWVAQAFENISRI